MFRILIADDHVLLLDTLGDYLRRTLEGCEIICVNSLVEVRKVLDTDPDVDLLIVDYFMPGSDGMETIQSLLDHPSRVSVAVISGMLDFRKVHELLQLGVVGYLPKTLSGMSMALAIRLMMSGERYVPASVFGSSAPVPAAPSRRMELAEREFQVLAHLRQGLTNKEIANSLKIEEATVKVYMARLARILGANNRVKILLAALEQGYID